MKIITRFRNFINEIFDTKTFSYVGKENDNYKYVFTLNNEIFLVEFTFLDDKAYHLQFCKSVGGVLDFNLIKNSSIGIKVFSNVKAITEDFLSKTDVDLLLYESIDSERSFIYINFAQHLTYYFDKYFAKDYEILNKKARAYILVKNNYDYTEQIANLYGGNRNTSKFPKT